ncbi:MAG TPA: M28 family peptidase [Candidatus Kapabacteria bacterium]|nr:M28 family peptidase [Candidatus Kapabacteria bacterium]
MIDRIDMQLLQERLRNHVALLAASPRNPGAPHHGVAAQYIGDTLLSAGFHVDEVVYDGTTGRCTNIQTAPFPSSPELPLLIVGAHYDSMPGVPGADDNASAVAALLELAAWIRPLIQQPLIARLQLVAYDLEESGHVGSFEHSRALARMGESLLCMISLEMLGYADERPGSQGVPLPLAGMLPNVANFICVCGNERTRAAVDRVAEAMRCVDGLPVEQLVVPGNGESFSEIRRSDHSEFWDNGYEALMITDTSFFRNPHYHRPTDRPETLSYSFLARVTAGVFAATERLLVGA